MWIVKIVIFAALLSCALAFIVQAPEFKSSIHDNKLEVPSNESTGEISQSNEKNDEIIQKPILDANRLDSVEAMGIPHETQPSIHIETRVQDSFRKSGLVDDEQGNGGPIAKTNETSDASVFYIVANVHIYVHNDIGNLNEAVEVDAMKDPIKIISIRSAKYITPIVGNDNQSTETMTVGIIDKNTFESIYTSIVKISDKLYVTNYIE